MSSLVLAKPNVHIKRAGPYLLGMPLGNSPVQSITNCLAREDDSDDFRVIKILKLQDKTVDDQQGKVLLHTEYTLLKFLEGLPGIVQQHGLFKDSAEGENGEIVTRLCLVLDCYVPHDFSPKYGHITNLQYYVVEVKRLNETEAIKLFVEVLKIVQQIHDLNIVHRDLKLGNIILNKLTGEIKLANFCLGKQLSHENELLKDQRGSPAYISPDVIKGEPYLGKPSDMWAMGVIFYTLLFGQFPFYDPSPSELFRKIKACEYTFPDMINVSPKSIQIIQGLLILDPKKRLTCHQVLEELSGFPSPKDNSQIVPNPDEDPASSSVAPVEPKNVRLVISRVKDEAKVLTLRELKKLHAIFQSKDGHNLSKALKRL
ncbi:unnamed protein product [Allacma fusca]|uniref:Serine/threonine-protein kinase 40 n=1 Tax=Allacma fusca TaxID=39272 RepID=A0A8J2LJL5_9HEXA|nr:unnamed protein product [Allacma fusca]